MFKDFLNKFKGGIKQVENVLKEKDFDEETKNIILSIIYKIQEVYPDYKEIKVNVIDEELFIQDILTSLKKIQEIELVKPKRIDLDEVKKRLAGDDGDKTKDKVSGSSNKGRTRKEIIYNKLIEKPEGERYIIEDGTSLIVYSSMLDVYSGIINIDKSYFNIKDEYIFKDTFQRILREGAILNKIELLTDFKGFSWYQNYNSDYPYIKKLIYQNLLWLLGEEFMRQWEKNDIDIIDFIKEMELSLIKQYGKDNAKSVQRSLYSLIYSYATEKEKAKIQKLASVNNERLKNVYDHKEFLEQIKHKKQNIIKKIENIDLVLNDDKLLIDAYNKNQNRKNAKSITVNEYVLRVQKQREKLLNDYELISKLQKPTNFLEYKQDVLKQIEIFNNKREINEAIIEFEKAVIRTIKYKAIKNNHSSQIIKQIKVLRYFKFQYINEKVQIIDIQELNDEIKALEQLLITIACKSGAIKIISYDINLNYKILSKIFETRILDLEDLLIEVDANDKFLGLRIYYKDTLEKEEMIRLENEASLNIKKRKKVRIFN